MVTYSVKSLPYFTQYGNPSNMVTFRPQCTTLESLESRIGPSFQNIEIHLIMFNI